LSPSTPFFAADGRTPDVVLPFDDLLRHPQRRHRTRTAAAGVRGLAVSGAFAATPFYGGPPKARGPAPTASTVAPGRR
jgi:hypothetical protein